MGGERGDVGRFGELTINLYVPMSNLNIIICSFVNWRGEKMPIKF